MGRVAKALLVVALVVVVAMAFRVSWNALRDVARTVGADAAAALLYPFVVDGLMALALVATLVLTGRDRTFALRVLAGYTLASLVLNYVHGLVPLHGGGGRVLADWAPANWALVLLATSLPVGSIFFGSDLVAKVLHHRPEPAPATSAEPAAELPEPNLVPVPGERVAAAVAEPAKVPVPLPPAGVPELLAGTGGTAPDQARPPGEGRVEQDAGTAGTDTGSAGSGPVPAESAQGRFARHVAGVRDWLDGEPELTGTAIGERLGMSDSYGRRVRRAAVQTSTGTA